ncbi:hypothetical protein QYF61_021518 [Mycteria americana]|uniref:Uncharacterized protein n=1 Tax=Mycteria americana TaxID=33587 RepID=A0AAN7NHN0_MYCAM|nr:hypothetical protein QYF61_021518 [Mycteria americana]
MSQDAIGLLGHLGTLLAHIQAAVNQHPQVLFRRAAFQPLFPKPVALHGVAVAQVQDLALGLVKPHTIGLSPWIQPVQVPLQSLPTLKQINTPTQLGVICKPTEGALDPLVQIIDKDIKQNWPQHRVLGNTTCDRPPTGFDYSHQNSLGLAIQFFTQQRIKTTQLRFKEVGISANPLSLAEAGCKPRSPAAAGSTGQHRGSGASSEELGLQQVQANGARLKPGYLKAARQEGADRDLAGKAIGEAIGKAAAELLTSWEDKLFESYIATNKQRKLISRACHRKYSAVMMSQKLADGQA